jgi:hypothetical protein
MTKIDMSSVRISLNKFIMKNMEFIANHAIMSTTDSSIIKILKGRELLQLVIKYPPTVERLTSENRLPPPSVTLFSTHLLKTNGGAS